MGEGTKLVTGVLALTLALAFGCGVAAASPVPPENPWLDQRGILNMAHQGGEMEAPSSTMYAFRTALEDRGADSLEMDVNATSDGHLMVMHDYYTSRITPLDAQVRDLTLNEIQALDAAYWFSPGSAQFDHSRPADQYPLRGVRTGEKQPPEGFTTDDFRIPTIEEVLAAFPGVPINIEIKTVPGNSAEAIRVATLLAAVLNRQENVNRPIIVASLDQNALVKFHELAPAVGVSASVASMVGFLTGGTAIDPDPVALQVPNVLGELDPPQMLKEKDVAAMGYAVHVWTDSFDYENDEAYGHMIDSGVQGIMTSAPSRLHDYLCRTGMRRPSGAPRCESQAMKYRLTYPSRSLRQYLTKGLPVKATCDQACSVRLRVSIRAKAAKRMGIKVTKAEKAAGLVRIGSLKAVLAPPKAGVNKFWAGAFGKPLKRLARVKRVQVQLVAQVYDGTGWYSGTERRRLKLASKRPLRPRR